MAHPFGMDQQQGGFFSIGGMTSVDVHGATIGAPIFAGTVSAFTILRADGRPVDLFHRALTDPEGAVTIQGLPDGDYRANVDAARAAPAITPVVAIRSGSARDLDVLLSRGVEVEVELRGEIPRRARM